MLWLKWAVGGGWGARRQASRQHRGGGGRLGGGSRGHRPDRGSALLERADLATEIELRFTGQRYCTSRTIEELKAYFASASSSSSTPKPGAEGTVTVPPS